MTESVTLLDEESLFEREFTADTLSVIEGDPSDTEGVIVLDCVMDVDGLASLLRLTV